MHYNDDWTWPWPSDSTSRRQSSWRSPPTCPGSIDQSAPQELPPHTTPWLPRGPGGQDGRLCRVGVFSVFMPVNKFLICDQPTSWPIVKNDPKVPAACAIFRPGHLRKPSPHQALVANHNHHHYHIYHSSLGTGDVTKTDEFSETFQTAFDPPPSFSENYVTIFFLMDTKPSKDRR